MPKLNAKKLSELGHRRREVMAQIKELETEKAKIDAQLETLEPGVPHQAGDVIIIRTPVRGLDSTAITKKFPASKRPEFYKLTLDTAEFKKHFSEIERQAFEKITYRTNVQDA